MHIICKQFVMYMYVWLIAIHLILYLLCSLMYILMFMFCLRSVCASAVFTLPTRILSDRMNYSFTSRPRPVDSVDYLKDCNLKSGNSEIIYIVARLAGVSIYLPLINLYGYA